MASIGEYGDSLRVCWTGVRGAEEVYDPAYSLGGERLGETVHIKAIIDNPIPPIRLRGFGATNVAGTGYITAADADSLSYYAPGDGWGTPVSIANGETVVLVSEDGETTVRVERVSADDLGGTMTLTLTPSHGGALGMDNVTEASGTDGYRGLMVHNEGAGAATDLKIWVEPILAASVTTDNLYMTGAFTTSPAYLPKFLGSTDSDAFADWPASGYARIEESDGTLREIVYYPSRTDAALNVYADGVSLLGTTHADGAATDKVFCVPGIRIAKDTVTDGAIQTVADAATAPAAVTWDSGITSATGLAEATIAADGELGLWIHREVVSAAVGRCQGNPAMPVQIGISWVSATVTYSGVLKETHAKLQTDSVSYWVYIGEDVAPDLTTTAYADATLPMDIAITPPVSGQTAFNVTVRQRGNNGLWSRNTYYRTVTVDDNGDEVVIPLDPPQDITVSNTSGGHARVQATYYPDHDAAPADKWRMYITTTGVDPDPDTDAATDVTMMRWGAIRPAYHLIYDTPAYAYGTDLRVLVRTYKTVGTVQSTNTTATALSIATAPEPQFEDRVQMTWGTARRAVFAPDATIDETVITDAGNNIHVDVTPGVAEFYADTYLVWRVMYDSLRPDKTFIYIPSEFYLSNYTYGAAGADDIIYTHDWGGAAQQLRINVGLTGAKTIQAVITLYAPLRILCDSWQATATMPNVHPASPLTAYPDQTVFSVYDAASARWVPYLSVNDAGAILTAIPINQSLTQAQIEAL